MQNLSSAVKIEQTSLKSSPVLKWAGGKSQLLPVLRKNYPSALKLGEIDTFIEPFMGGGAVFFDIANSFTFKQAFLLDVNPDLIILYQSIKEDVEGVISELKKLSDVYLADSDDVRRKNFYYVIREEFNEKMAKAHADFRNNSVNLKRSAHTIFLNRTCFNGLWRVNSKGLFNVPQGRYKNPSIVFADKLRAASLALKKATIILSSFEECTHYISGKTFIYYDPPYRPLTNTAQFTSYSKEGFNDDSQIRLAELFRKLDKKGIFQLLSNSDPTNSGKCDPFFDNLYRDFHIQRVEAKRMINSNASKRHVLREILIKNYQ